MIRPATLGDIPDIARLGAFFHAAAGWDEIAYNAGDCERSLHGYMANPAFICIVADDGHIMGMAAGVVSPVYFNHGHVSGEELFWYVSPDAPQMTGIRLLDALEKEAKQKGCQTWQMKALARLGGERMVSLYARRGYRAAEQSFIKEL
jgi:hypothetical protein